MADTTLTEVYRFFKRPEDTIASFAAEWRALTDQDRKDLKSGLANGSLTY